MATHSVQSSARGINHLLVHTMHHTLRSAQCAVGALVIGATASTASAQWTVINLHPAGTILSSGLGASGGQQVGYALVGPTVGHSRASLWSGTAASWVNLHPTGMGYSLAHATDGAQQVGEYYPAGFPRASLWNGTAASWVDLHPAGPSASSAFGVGGGNQVGRTYSGFYSAALWSGTAASWVNLNPPPTDGYGHASEAYGVGGGQQVGYVIAVGGVQSASLWTGSAVSWVNLHPAAVGADFSQAFATDGLQQVGIARTDATTVVNASLWTGTAASWVSLNPAGVAAGRANAVHGGQQVGFVGTTSGTHASLWSGTAASWVDLHTFLPTEFNTYSTAMGISHDGGFTYVVGYGFNGVTHREEALLWVGKAPTVCVGDLDGGGSVSGFDLASLLGQWSGAATYSPCPPYKPEDLNQDCKVNGLDLALLLGAWGPCP